MRVTYVGHATLLLELGGVVVLTDPNFDPALGPVALGSRLRRVAPPGVALGALPRLDAVLVTHAHLDHLSLASLRVICAGDAPPPVLAPPGVARWLRGKGFATAAALAPGGGHTLGALGAVRVRAAAAAHVGARWGALDRARGRAEAQSYVLDAGDPAGGGGGSLFFAGDTALVPGTAAFVREALGGTPARPRAPDVALLPVGHAPAWKRARFRAGHLTAADALELFGRLGARWMVPYHWGTFNHLTSDAYGGIAALRALVAAGHALGSRVRVLEPGERWDVDETP